MKSNQVAAIAMKEKDSKHPDEWQVKNWADTVTEGESIKNDPKKMRHVKKHLTKMHKAIGCVVGKVKSTDDLRKKAKEMESASENAAEDGEE